MKYRFVIFDMDGTVLDTLEDLHLSLNAALSLSHLPSRTLEETRQFVGNGMWKLIERAVPTETAQDIRERVYRDFTQHYQLHCADHTHPYFGIPAFLRELRAYGIGTAVVSNKNDDAVRQLCERYFAGLFDFATGYREPFSRKPSPDLVELAMRTLHAKKEETIYVGDSEVDIETAQNTGIECISVTWGFRSSVLLMEKGAKHICNSTSDLWRVLQ